MLRSPAIPPLAIVLAAALVSAPALAQSDATCGEAATEAERIACLEARVRALEAALAGAERSEEPAMEAAPPTTASAPGPAVAAPAVAAPPPAPVAVAATPAGPESFGAEQVAPPARDGAGGEDGMLRAKVATFEELPHGRLRVTLDNGQIWRQLDPDGRRTFVEAGDDVEVRRSGFGGYRMKIGDNRHVLPVERVR